MRFIDIDPQDIDPNTNRPYRGYSSPSLDTSFHDREMAVDETPEERAAGIEAALRNIALKLNVFSNADQALLDEACEALGVRNRSELSATEG